MEEILTWLSLWRRLEDKDYKAILLVVNLINCTNIFYIVCYIKDITAQEPIQCNTINNKNQYHSV